MRLITTTSLQEVLLPPHVLKLQRAQSRMSAPLVMARPGGTALTVANLLAEYQVVCVTVVDPTGALLGLVLRQDVLRFQARQLDLAQLSVQAIMRDPQFSLQPNDSLWLAYQEMNQRHLPCLAVMNPAGQPVGVVTQTDLLYNLDLRELHSSFSHLWQAFRQSDSEPVELWKNYSAELERLVQGRTSQLEEQAQCDRLLTSLTQRIHESLEVQTILSTTVSEVRQLLQADRALIYRFETAARGTVAVEAVVAPWGSLLGRTIEDESFAQHWAEAYRYGRIQTSVHHVIGLLNDVLTVGKAEAHKLDCTIAPIDLHQLCRDLVEEGQFAQVDRASPIAFSYQGDGAPVLADEKLLRHILLNLLSNAVKYSPDHSPVTFGVSRQGRETVFQVSDRGIGIPPVDQARLFGAFHRAENVGNISGTGLGLVIAKRAAEAHQGQISFTSEVGVGTTFTVRLPLAQWQASPDRGD